MGLDVYAYRNAERVEDPTEEQAEELHEIFGGDFPDHLAELVDGAYYDAEETGAHYRRSYTGHSAFREVLAKLAGYKPLQTVKPSYSDPDFMDRNYWYNYPYSAQVWTQKEGPFSELICFSDCEGYIGPSICKKLAGDFAKFEKQAKNLNEYDKQSYFQFKAVFDAAADNGFAKFS